MDGFFLIFKNCISRWAWAATHECSTLRSEIRGRPIPCTWSYWWLWDSCLRCWELNSGALLEKPTLLTAETSLPSPLQSLSTLASNQILGDASKTMAGEQRSKSWRQSSATQVLGHMRPCRRKQEPKHSTRLSSPQPRSPLEWTEQRGIYTHNGVFLSHRKNEICPFQEVTGTKCH